LVLAQSVTRKNLREEGQAATLKNGKEHGCKRFPLAKQGHLASGIQ
jgi:hypothetical protein